MKAGLQGFFQLFFHGLPHFFQTFFIGSLQGLKPLVGGIPILQEALIEFLADFGQMLVKFPPQFGQFLVDHLLLQQKLVVIGLQLIGQLVRQLVCGCF